MYSIVSKRMSGWMFAAAVLAVCAGSQTCKAENEVPWLNEVRRPPEKRSSFDVGLMQPLLVDDDQRPIQDAAAWKTRREQLKEKWRSFLGPMPEPPLNDSITVLREDSVSDCTRQLIRYECEAGQFVEAWLLRPTDPQFDGLRPGLVALHQTTNQTIDEVAGISGPESLQLGFKLAKRGFVVICPRCFLWQDATTLQSAVERFQQRHPKTLGMHKMLYDARRAVDILIAQPNVDRKRLGAVGHSLGAKEVLYLAAFDERIKAAVASEGGLALSSTNWDAPWYLGPAIHEQGFSRNHHELLALIAPRALLILGGETGPGAADGDRSWPLIEAAIPVYRLFDLHPKIGLLNHHEGHSIPSSAFERLAVWLMAFTSHI